MVTATFALIHGVTGAHGIGTRETYADAVVQVVGGRHEVVVAGDSRGCFTAPLVCGRIPVDLLVLVAG